jgi:hypothetical protein
LINILKRKRNVNINIAFKIRPGKRNIFWPTVKSDIILMVTMMISDVNVDKKSFIASTMLECLIIPEYVLKT